DEHFRSGRSGCALRAIRKSINAVKAACRRECESAVLLQNQISVLRGFDQFNDQIASVLTVIVGEDPIQGIDDKRPVNRSSITVSACCWCAKIRIGKRG